MRLQQYDMAALLAAFMLPLIVAVVVAGGDPQPQTSTVIIHKLDEACHEVDTLGPGHTLVRLICVEHGDTILVAEVFTERADVEAIQLKQAMQQTGDELDELRKVLDEYRKQQEAPPR